MIIEEKQKYKDTVYSMWQRNFHDPAPYAEFYFTEVYGKNDILLNVSSPEEKKYSRERELEGNGANEEAQKEQIKGMLHLNPYQLRVCKHTVPSHYIVGVATDEAWRRQGVMRALLLNTFSRLRKQGEIFTYLMPADENYYLPFDFRFGMCQIEQEVECFKKAPAPEGTKEYTFISGLPEDLETVSKKENAARDGVFSIHTKITPEYFIRMEKETKSDFGKLLFVYRNGEYQGRFVVGAEDSYMTLSQISCMEKERRKEFLYQALYFCEQEYHYGKYQLTLDESWESVLMTAGNYGGARLLPLRKQKMIMFRLLNLEKIGPYLKTKKPFQCQIYVEDENLPEQNGTYQWTASQEGSVIRKLQSESADGEINGTKKAEDGGNMIDAGRITVGTLGELIFGKQSLRKRGTAEGLTAQGREMLESLCTFAPICIQEFV